MRIIFLTNHDWMYGQWFIPHLNAGSLGYHDKVRSKWPVSSRRHLSASEWPTWYCDPNSINSFNIFIVPSRDTSQNFWFRQIQLIRQIYECTDPGPPEQQYPADITPQRRATESQKTVPPIPDIHHSCLISQKYFLLLLSNWEGRLLSNLYHSSTKKYTFRNFGLPCKNIRCCLRLLFDWGNYIQKWV